MESSITFGARLKKLRQEKKLSQEELAFQCNMQASHIGQLERGQKNPTLDTLIKIANGFEITLPELLDFDEKPQNKNQNPTVNKINAYLSALTEKQQKQVLAIIKTFLD